MIGDEVTRIQERMKTMHGIFKILKVERKKNLFFRYLEITAQDKDSEFVVTVRLEGSPDQERVMEALKYELDYAKRRDNIGRLQGKTIAY
jgi:hypothetical protein